jgi:hypothetical protein
MKFKEFDVAGKKERSDRLADMLRAAGIRFEQRTMTKAGRGPVYVIRVHPEDLGRAGEVHAEATRREDEAFVRTLQFVRRTYGGQDMLIALEPNEAGYYASRVYHGEPFDPTRSRVVRGGWDHEHCYLCWAKVLPGEEWWATHPANFENEIGLCLDCYARLFA